ncbi:RNA polymerase sigma factor [Crocinitomicaceae bacterium]|nr:RNA polymerase sigma factor [Crocinitomicaceae bacterium]
MKEEELNSLVLKVQQGDSKAFEKIYDAYSAALFGICKKILLDTEIAEDVLQDAFIKIWQKSTSYDPSKGTFFTWMLNIARNTSIDKYRKLSKNTTFSIQNNEDYVSINKEDSKGNTISTNHIGIKDLLSSLPEEQQIMIEYLYYKGYTQQEVSDELNIPLGTVKTRSRSALKALSELFIVIITWI